MAELNKSSATCTFSLAVSGICAAGRAPCRASERITTRRWRAVAFAWQPDSGHRPGARCDL